MASYTSIFVAGTDTGVGKTHVTCRILRRLREQGINAAGAKPVASGMQSVNGEWLNEDIQAICEAADSQFGPELINQYRYKPYIAPHIAAAEQGEMIDMGVIMDGFRRLAARAELVVVEGAGGLMTPLNEQHTFLHLMRLLNLPVILVVAIRLGCINHALLAQQGLESAGIPLLAWVANYPAADTVRDTAVEESLVSRLNAPLLGIIPWSSASVNVEMVDLVRLIASYENGYI